MKGYVHPEKLFIGKGTARRDLSVLEALGLVECRREPMSNYSDRFYEYWKLKTVRTNNTPIYNIPLKLINLYNVYIHSNISPDGLKTPPKRDRA